MIAPDQALPIILELMDRHIIHDNLCSSFVYPYDKDIFRENKGDLKLICQEVVKRISVPPSIRRQN